jgi:hypothetical protein
VELFIRDTLLDTGRGVNTDGRNDPSIFPTAPVVHYQSPNIKIDVPTPAGYQTPMTAIDFFTFNEVIVDGSNGVGTNVPPPTVHNRVYVELHNRGRVDAANVQAMAVVTNAATGLMLPAGYTANVAAGMPLPGSKWVTLGVQNVKNLRAGFPAVMCFDLPSTVLPLPASLPGDSHWCMCVFLHSLQDPYTSTERNVDNLTLSDRKVGQKNLHIVEFVGAPPPPGTGIGMWAMLIVNGEILKRKARIDLVIDAKRFRGNLRFALPPPLFPANPREQAKTFKVGTNAAVKKWADQHIEAAKRLYFEAKYPEAQYKLLVKGIKNVATQRTLDLAGGQVGAIQKLTLTPNDSPAIFFRVDLPKNTKVGAMYDFDIQQRESESGKYLGGAHYRVVVNKTAGSRPGALGMSTVRHTRLEAKDLSREMRAPIRLEHADLGRRARLDRS